MNTRRDILKAAIGLSLGTGLATVLSGCATAEPGAAVPDGEFPKVSGPITGGKHGRPFASYLGNVSDIGYVEEEFFIEGDAHAYNFIGDFPTDGRFNVQKAGAQPYKTRLLVRRPADPKKFNGTVLVEWINVSAGFDIATCDPTGIYEGFAWVAVSAQRVGVHGYAVPTPRPDLPSDKGLRDWDPERYSSLSIPGDSLSYDIFTQGARAVGPKRPRSGRRSGTADPMGGLEVKKLVAIGASQSGVRLVSYVNGVQPQENVFDAVMPMVFFGFSATWIDGDLFSAAASAGPVQSGPTPIRNDISAKVFGLNSETEAVPYLAVRQPDTDTFRYWEIAGASHGGTAQGERIDKIMQRDGVAPPPPPPPPADQPAAQPAIRGSDVLWHPTCAAAVHQVHRWITTGEAPPIQPLIEFDLAVTPPQPKLDTFGNALGGVRLPELEVPIAIYDGSTQASPFGGHTLPFSPEQLKELYTSHEDYVAKVTAAAEKALQDGVILQYRVDEYIAEAQAAAIPG
jgi:hypothetical protein